MISAGDCLGATKTIQIPQWLDDHYLFNNDILLLETAERSGEYNWAPLKEGCVFLRKEDPGPDHLKGFDLLLYLCHTPAGFIRNGVATLTHAGGVRRGEKGIPPIRVEVEESIRIPDVVGVHVGKPRKSGGSGADRVAISVRGGGAYVYEVTYNPWAHIGL